MDLASPSKAPSIADLQGHSQAFHPVVQVLMKRRTAESERTEQGGRSDGCKVGLAVEGGAMRGIVAGGMLAALDELGLRHVFDGFYGSSGGAISLAYFVASELWDPLAVYYSELVTKDFIDFSRALRHKPIVSLDFLFNEVLTHRKPLDYDSVLESSIPLHVTASSVEQIEAVTRSSFSSREDLSEFLKAGSWLPLVAGPPPVTPEGRFLDAAVLLPHPYWVARADGCTHILSLSTRARGSIPRRPAPWRVAVARYLNRLNEGLGDASLQTHHRYMETFALFNGVSSTPDAGPTVLNISPAARSHSVTRLCRDPWTLLNGARAGYEAVHATFAGRDVHAIPRFILKTS